MYVPRDEQFEESKMNTFSTGRLKAVLHNLLPQLMAGISANNKDFKGFSDIDSLYSEGLLLKLGLQEEILNKIPLPKIVGMIQEGGLLKFDLPKIISKDKNAWLRDDEFGRQAIAGVNPVSIERLTTFPPVSKLDPEIHGPQESALKEEHISYHLNGMTEQEALDSKKLYIIDYHDVYLSFLDKINALDGRKSYANRTPKLGSTRKTIAVAFGQRCEVNLSLLEKLLERHKFARLLGYTNYADYKVGIRMTKSSAKDLCERAQGLQGLKCNRFK